MITSAKITIIAGPTASGKSSVALSLAQKTGGVIINADSQQMYADLRVLTARPSVADEALAPHKLYGALRAHEACSAGLWLNMAKMEIDWALGQGRQAIVVGGTGLYIKALMQGIAEIPDIDPAVRAQAMNDFEAMGKEAFAARLREIDPAFFERLKVQDRQRLVRAYEVWLGSGKTLSWWQGRAVTPPYAPEHFECFQVAPERATLYRNCDARFEQMLESGALEEVRALMELTLSPSLPIVKTLGVKELSAYLRGDITLEAAKASAQQATRNYAKRQLTWLRNQMPGLPSLSPAG